MTESPGQPVPSSYLSQVQGTDKTDPREPNRGGLTTHASVVRVHVGPETPASILGAIQAAGAELADIDEADAIVWVNAQPTSFPSHIPASVRWVQLPAAGVETWCASGVIDSQRTWTSAAGAYARTVAEHALTLLLCGIHQIAACARHTAWQPEVNDHEEVGLAGTRVGIIGAGGIGRELVSLLTPFNCEVWAVTRQGLPTAGAHHTLAANRIDEVWPAVDHLILAAPATAATRHLVNGSALRQMSPHLCLVNVGRGSLIDTDALVDALEQRRIAFAALDVTEPEPLPLGHPLWQEPRALITPHVANPRRALLDALAHRVTENLHRWSTGQNLVGTIDVQRGY